MQIKEYTIDELKTFRENLVKEFTEANDGVKNSLAFAKNFIKKNNIENSKKEQVIVIGGTNLATAIVEKNNGHVTVLSQESEPLPVFKTKDILFQYIKSHLKDGIDKIGLNFAYPLEAVFRDGKLDGKLIKGTKEHNFDGLVGKVVGEEIEQFLLNDCGKKVDVSVANDTVCLVLSGMEKDEPINLVGGVVGTGFNFGFFIDENTVVNLESGNFNEFTQTESGKYLDEISNQPGAQRWEKEISGAYLYQHYNYYLKESGQEDKAISSTAELSQVAADENHGYSAIARKIFKRSSSLVAAQIAAIYDYKKNNPITVIVEGSLFWKGYAFEKTVTEVLKELDVNVDSIKIIPIDNSSVMGAAHLIM